MPYSVPEGQSGAGDERGETDEGGQINVASGWVRTFVVGLEGEQGVGVDHGVAEGGFVRQRVLRGSGGSSGSGANGSSGS
jgi:hypothetical protein